MYHFLQNIMDVFDNKKNLKRQTNLSHESLSQDYAEKLSPAVMECRRKARRKQKTFTPMMRKTEMSEQTLFIVCLIWKQELSWFCVKRILLDISNCFWSMNSDASFSFESALWLLSKPTNIASVSQIFSGYLQIQCVVFMMWVSVQAMVETDKLSLQQCKLASKPVVWFVISFQFFRHKRISMKE